jgi:hypothetical protein
MMKFICDFESDRFDKTCVVCMGNYLMWFKFGGLKEENTQSIGTSKCVLWFLLYVGFMGIPKGKQWVAFVKLFEIELLTCQVLPS